MAALDFPASPTVGQVATLTNGFSYQWDGAVWALAASTGQAAGGDLQGTYPNPTLAPLSVTTGKLAVGATVGANVSATFPVNFASGTTGSFVIVLTLPVLNTRGGWVLLTGGPGAFLVGTTGGSTLYVQLARNGTAIATWRYDAQGAGGNIKVIVPSISWIEQPAAGAWTYAYQIQQTVSASFSTTADNAGVMRAVELA